jgi:hypothetical protein
MPGEKPCVLTDVGTKCETELSEKSSATVEFQSANDVDVEISCHARLKGPGLGRGGNLVVVLQHPSFTLKIYKALDRDAIRAGEVGVSEYPVRLSQYEPYVLTGEVQINGGGSSVDPVNFRLTALVKRVGK